jgi:serine/threonine protein kinase
MSLIGQTIHGNLRIRSLIGEGAMGAVFLAENLELPDRKYAVKVLLNPITSAAMFQERFNEEARNQAGLDHPNIVRVYDYFTENGRYYLVMDYVDGESLQAIIDESGKLEEKRALAIMDDVLRGLDCAHQHGIVHRDVKPSNILVDRSGRARLTDFGIAIRAGEMRLTATGVAAVGTAAYMSPEQIRTPAEIDHRADVYSSGIVLFEMLCGDVPFHGETDFAVQQQQVKARPPSVRSLNSAVSARVARIIQLALAKEPRNRIQGCERFRGMLAGEIEPPFPWKRVLQGVAAVLLCAGIVLSAPLWLQWIPRTTSPPALVDPELTSETTMEASRNFESLCRESAQQLNLEKGKKIAEQIPDSARVEKFDREIGESRQKIADLAQQYNLNVRKLAAIDQPTVAEALHGAATDSSRAPFINAIESQLTQVRATPRDIAVSELLQFCGSLPGDSP